MRRLPLFLPPIRPSATAAGFFRLFTVVIGIGSDVDSRTTRKAASFTSSILRFAMPHNGMGGRVIQWGGKTKLYHYPETGSDLF